MREAAFDYGGTWWREERAKVLDGWDGYCAGCLDPTDSPHVHHVYGTKVREYAIVCPDCHGSHHGNERLAEWRRGN